MAETLLDALVKLSFEGENAVGQAAEVARRVESELKKIGSMPDVNFQIGKDLPKTIDTLAEVSHAFQRLTQQAQEADAALRLNPKNAGAAEEITRVAAALQQQIGAIREVQAAQSAAHNETISQARAEMSVLERRKAQLEELQRLGKVNAQQADFIGRGLDAGQSLRTMLDYGIHTRGMEIPSLGGGSAAGNTAALIEQINAARGREPDNIFRARGRLQGAQEERQAAQAAYDRLDPGDDDFAAARRRTRRALEAEESANAGLVRAIDEHRRAEEKAAETARKIGDARDVRSGQGFADLRNEDYGQFLTSVGIDPNASAAEQRTQLAKQLLQADLVENRLKSEEVTNQQELAKLTRQRARLEVALNVATEKEIAAAQTAAIAENEARNASNDPRLSRLGASADQYAAARGIDTGEPLTRQRLQLAQQQNALAQQAIREEAERIKTLQQDNATEKRVAQLDEQKARLVREELSLRQQSAALAARERKAASGTGGFLGGLFGKNEDDDGFGQGLAYSGGMTLRFYAMYAGFAALQQALAGVFEMTEQYTLAVHDLSVALGTSYEEAAKAGTEYTKIGEQFGVGPVEAIQAATKGLRSFRNQDGSVNQQSGEAFTRVSSIINTIEPEDRRQNTQQDLIAVAKAFQIGASGLEGLYDKLLSVSHEYGYGTPGEILSGTAAVADIGKESGYTPEALAAAIASVMQGTGTTSDAAAGDLKRFFGAQNDPALIRLFSRYGIDQDGTLKEKLDALASKLGDVDPEQRSRDLTALGGPRIASAVNALIAGIPEANRAQTKAQGAGGESAQQARELLDTLGGMMQKLGAELKLLFAALANSGAGAVFVGIVQAFTQVITVTRQMLDEWNQVPGVLKAVVASIITLMAIAKAQAVLGGAGGAAGVAGAAAGGGILARLLGGAGGAAVGGGLASFGAGGAALGPLSGLAAGAGASMASLGASLKATALGAGRLAAALGPLAAIIGGIILVADAKSSGEGQQRAAQEFVEGNNDLNAALNENDPEKARAAIARLQQAKRDASAAASTPGGVAMDIFSDVDDQRRAAFDAVNARIAKAMTEIDQIEAGLEEADRKAPRSEWFGKNYNNISNGVALIKAKGVAADPATAILGDLLLQNAQVVQNALQPGEGQEGAAALQEYIMGRISTSNSPLGQEKSYGALSQVLRNARDRVRATGDATQIESLRVLQDQVDRAWAASVVETTKAKIDVAAGGFVGKQSEQQIRAVLTEGLNKATQAGDVNAIVQLLNLADRQFIEAYKAAHDAQKIVLNSIQNSLNVALETIGDSFQGIAGNADTGNVRDDIRNDMKDVAARRVVSLFDNNFNAASDALDEAMKLANPTGSATQKPGQDLAIAQAMSDATAGNGLEQAQAAVKAAQIKFDALAGGPKNAAYYDALKALNDSKYALGQYELNQALAEDAALVESGNPMAEARNAITATQRKLAAAVDPIEIAQLTKQLNDQWRSYREMQLSAAEAEANARVLPNDPLAAAVNAMNQATARMEFYKGKDSTKYWEAYRQYRQSQYEAAMIELEMANNQALLTIDITDPVALAQQRVKQSQAKLSYDQQRGAGQDVILADEAALRQNRSDAANTQWSQNFQDMQTNYNLNRIGLTAYLQYLRSQHDYLSAVQNRTRQQTEQLNQVDAAIKGLTDSMQGQWNLGDIKVPTAYEMRRAVAGGMAAGVANVSYVTITMNGSSTAEMKSVIQQAIGQPILQTVGTSAPKV